MSKAQKSKVSAKLCKDILLSLWSDSVIVEVKIIYTMIYTCVLLKDQINMLKSKNQETLFVNYSYSNIYDISSSENVYSEPKVMCQNMELFVYLGVI